VLSFSSDDSLLSPFSRATTYVRSQPYQRKMDPIACDACGKAKYPDKDLLKCSRCRQAHYHDKVCQKKHWPKHKVQCKKLLLRKQEEDEQRRHVKVINTEEKGRVLRALRDFGPGDRIFLESPAIVFDRRLDYFGLLQAFGSASQETRSKVLDLHSPPLYTLNSEGRQRRHARLEQQRQTYLRQFPELSGIVTEATTQKLLAIIETNAHQLFNDNLGENSDPDAWMGLFVLGSMPEHSCNPNMTMNTTSDGKLEFLAETHISKGERLSFSYIEGIFEKSKQQRQDQLMTEKHFHCKCSRCQDVDECRPIFLKKGDKTDPSWNCQVCGSCHPLFWHPERNQYICIYTPSPKNETMADNNALKLFEQQEASLCNHLERLKQSLQNGEAKIEQVLEQLAQLWTNEITAFHPFHWLQVSAHHFLSTTAAAIARVQHQQQQQNQQQQQPKASLETSSLLRLSVLALLHNIIWTESVVTVLRNPSSPSSAYHVLRDAMTAAHEESHPFCAIRNALAAALSSTNSLSFLVEPSALGSIIRMLCDSPKTSLENKQQSTTADSLLTAFYAGQDLLLAGDVDFCLQLYQRYQAWFRKLKQPSDDNRDRIDLFLSSRGRTIPFADIMML